MLLNLLKSKRTAQLSLIFSLFALGCGTDQHDSNLEIIGGDYIKKEDPLVKSVVYLEVLTPRDHSNMEKLMAAMTGLELPTDTISNCTGTVINDPNSDKKWHVVTAAHCLQGNVKKVNVYIGSREFSQYPNPKSKEDVKESNDKIVSHVEETGNELTMAEQGYELIASSSKFQNHEGYNSRKSDLRNEVTSASAAFRSKMFAATIASNDLYISNGVLSDLKSKSDEFFNSLKNPFEIAAYQKLAKTTKSDLKTIENLVAKNKDKVALLESELQLLEKSLNAKSKEYQIAKNHADDDIALLSLEGEIPTALSPIALPSTETPSLDKGAKVSLIGYGFAITDVAKEHWDSPFEPEKFKTIGDLKSIDLEVSTVNHKTKEAEILNKEEGGLCHGDSGGPALVKDQDNYILVGVNTQANCSDYSKVTLVSEYLHWLNETMAQ